MPVRGGVWSLNPKAPCAFWGWSQSGSGNKNKVWLCLGNACSLIETKVNGQSQQHRKLVERHLGTVGTGRGIDL